MWWMLETRPYLRSIYWAVRVSTVHYGIRMWTMPAKHMGIQCYYWLQGNCNHVCKTSMRKLLIRPSYLRPGCIIVFFIVPADNLPGIRIEYNDASKPTYCDHGVNTIRFVTWTEHKDPIFLLLGTPLGEDFKFMKCMAVRADNFEHITASYYDWESLTAKTVNLAWIVWGWIENSFGAWSIVFHLILSMMKIS